MFNKIKEIVNARQINKMRWISGLVICLIVFVITSVSLALNIGDYYSETSPEAGFGTLRMFTTISNMIASVAAFACIPFQIDGIRKDKYKLPNWIVILMYVGAVGTFLTFIIAITLISIVQGFVKTMFYNSNLFLHTINPIFITILFVLAIPDGHIKFKHSFFAIIPIGMYSILYYIMVFVAGVWRDHYQTNKFMPWPVTLIIVLLTTFGIAQLLRYLHNLQNRHVDKSIIRYFMESKDYEFPKVSDAVANLAKVESKFYHEGDDIYIPVDIIELLAKRYSATSVPVDILYDIYLENYLICIQHTVEENN